MMRNSVCFSVSIVLICIILAENALASDRLLRVDKIQADLNGMARWLFPDTAAGRHTGQPERYGHGLV